MKTTKHSRSNSICNFITNRNYGSFPVPFLWLLVALDNCLQTSLLWNHNNYQICYQILVIKWLHKETCYCIICFYILMLVFQYGFYLLYFYVFYLFKNHSGVTPLHEFQEFNHSKTLVHHLVLYYPTLCLHRILLAPSDVLPIGNF